MKLSELYQQHMAATRPGFPSYALPAYNAYWKAKTPANKLKRQIEDICTWSGNMMESTENIPAVIVEKQHTASGYIKEVVKGRRKGTKVLGTSDMKGTIASRSVYIEIKIGRDSQSDHQIAYQARVERTGGLYWIVKTLDGFLELFNEITGMELEL